MINLTILNLCTLIIKLIGNLKCNKCLNIFNVRPDQHLHYWSGCPFCNFKHNNIYTKAIKEKIDYSVYPCTLYCIRLIKDDEEFYKIGITCSSLYRRFQDLYYDYEVFYEVKTNLKQAKQFEYEVLNKFKSHKYKPKVKFNGYTECFSNDIKEELFLFVKNCPAG